MNIVPLLGLAARGIPSCDRDGRDLLLIHADTTYVMPEGGVQSDALTLAEQQPPVIVENVYAGEPGASSLLRELPSAYTRLGTDVHVIGQAWAPGAVPTTRVEVGVQVGPCRQTALVFGERRWTAWMTAGAPAPFVSLPLWWEHAYGGAVPGDPRTMVAHNPIGRGVYASAEAAIGERLPAIEDPTQLMSAPGDRPAPVGFALVPPSWRPRSEFVGTYDERWKKQRAPLWPEDFDERFFQSAAPGLSAPGFLVGGEFVALVGLDPRGPISFPLPSPRLVVETEFRGRPKDERAPVLDVVTLDLERRELCLTWRVTIPAAGALGDHVVSYVRHGDS